MYDGSASFESFMFMVDQSFDSETDDFPSLLIKAKL